MKKLLLLSFIALIPCTKLVDANEMAPQLAGPKSTINSPIAPFTGMNDSAGATCPTEEELMNALRQEMTPEQFAEFEKAQNEFKQMSPEEQQQLLMAAMEDMISQLPPEQQEELGLLALEEVGQEILQTPEGQAFAQGVEAGAELGAALKEQQIAQEVNEAVQVMAPMIEAEMAKNQPYTPALK